LAKYFQIIRITPEEPLYPQILREYLSDEAPCALFAIGNPEILALKKLAFFCSVKCPGHLIIETYNLAQRLKGANVTVIGGFHSPIERECLTILLRGTQPIIVCPARSIKEMRIRVEYKEPLREGRLLLFSPFKDNQRRSIAETAFERNRFVAMLADAVFVAHAAPDSKTDQFCRDVLEWQKPLFTLESNANINLINLGAKPVNLDNAAEEKVKTDLFLG